ncbi:MAG: insulinase family protein [Paludibacteraceae bacterium]|nr:insulinase family protein [Paludibacteraceae bacterium]
MKKFLLSCLVSIILFPSIYAQRPELKQFKLDNGLTVFLWEDPDQSDVLGQIVVRAGSMDEPSEYTGLAHYLEHVLFKGTQSIGALDWESEKPHYEKIISLYDQLAETTDPEMRQTLITDINKESLSAAQYGLTNEFSNLIEAIGGTGLNAGTSYDMTVYYNSFPAYQMERWLDLYSERFINPVFRTFQAELENVYEEFNMYQDNRSTHVSNYIFSHIYPGHPYGRDIIGTQEHLKNPRLSKLIEFYNTWYVPNNMALILSGNFKSEEVIPLIKAKFERLEAKPLPERKAYPLAKYTHQKFTERLGYYPQMYWAFEGVKKGDPDELLLDFCTNILTNSSGTGLLDRLSIDGDVMAAGGYNMARRDQGTILIIAIPSYDINQRRYLSDKETQNVVFNEIKKLGEGKIPDWLIQSVKESICKEFDLTMESSDAIASVISDAFVYNENIEEVFRYKEAVMAITKEDIQRTVQRYFNTDNYILFSFMDGSPKRNKLQKPAIKPIEQPKSKESEYAKAFKNIPMGQSEEVYNDFGRVQIANLDQKTKLFYSNNPKNDIFSLVIKYGVGTDKMPKLALATQILNNAGIMPNTAPQDVKRMFCEANATCTYACDDSYFYIKILGNENKLAEACQIMQKQIFMPKLEMKQLDNAKGSVISMRMTEQKDPDVLEDALVEYLLYKDKSDYLDRLSIMDIYNLPLAELTGEIIRATQYQAEVHYAGKLPIEQVTEVLKANLPLTEGGKSSESPVVKEVANYETPVIYFLPNSETQQSKIYFYIHGKDYNCADDVDYNAFYQYFSGGFNGLVMNEIRENNSMAYTTYGYISRPPVPNKPTYFLGFIGTQADKTVDAVKLFMKLLTDMPLYPERIDNVKTYLREVMLSQKPSFRNASFVFENWKRIGYTEDPAKANMEKLNNLTFDDIVRFYNENIKNKPISIVIMGNKKDIDLKALKEVGKVKTISVGRLFMTEEGF